MGKGKLTAVHVLAAFDNGQVHWVRLREADGTSEIIWRIQKLVVILN